MSPIWLLPNQSDAMLPLQALQARMRHTEQSRHTVVKDFLDVAFVRMQIITEASDAWFLLLATG